MRKWYRYRFADGYKVEQGRMSTQERRVLESRHGKLIGKVAVS